MPKRLLSLLLCLSMFLSLGFAAYAQPNEGEEQEGQILPVETEAEQEPVLTAETEAEGQGPSFTLEANPLVIEQPGGKRVLRIKAQQYKAIQAKQSEGDAGKRIPFRLRMEGADRYLAHWRPALSW